MIVWASPAGLEPATIGLGNRCAIRCATGTGDAPVVLHSRPTRQAESGRVELPQPCDWSRFERGGLANAQRLQELERMVRESNPQRPVKNAPP